MLQLNTTKWNGPHSKTLTLLSVLILILSTGLYAEGPPKSPFGADAVPDLYAPNIAGPGGFTTTTGGAPASALNPAQGGAESRIVFDVGYLAIPGLGKEDGYLHAIEGGALFPSRYGVFGGSMRYIGRPFDEGPDFDIFPIDRTISGNLFAAKEIYSGMSVGAGLNVGAGADWTLSADLGFRYNTGSLGILHNFTWAVVMRGMGKSYFPTWFTPMGGVSFDLLRIEGRDGKRDPFVLNVKGDLGVPSIFYFPQTSLIFKAGIDMTIAELISLSLSWPGGSGLNARELAEKSTAFPAIPSIGLGVNIILPSKGERIAGGRLPSDGDLKIDTAFKPLYEGVTAIGAGATWYVGLTDKKPPIIETDYSETEYFSPNNDGKADFLEFPIDITDDKYVVSWTVEIKDEEGNVVRTIENKELRDESRGFRNFFSRLFAVKRQIDVPPTIRWDGLRNEGDLAADGNYYFTITSTDDSDNTAVSPVYTVVLKNIPPEISVDSMSDTQRIFNPRGVGERDTITFVPRGSEEDAWESGIYNAAGVKIRSFENESGSPRQRVWDGRDDSGRVAPDGVYSYRIGATDRAQNSADAALNNIILDTREAGVFVTSSVSAIAPKIGEYMTLVDFNIHLSLTDGVENWRLELRNETGAVTRTFSGGANVPSTQSWNGLDERGLIREGVYTPELTVSYTRGDTVRTTATTVMVDVTGPELSASTAPEFFSPDNDGEDDELYIRLSAIDASPIAGWSFVIREPEPPYLEFRRFEGRGNPAAQLIWDGRSARGELVQSATDYPYTFTAEDALGNSSSAEGRIGVDVLVIRDGDRLKIQIPSIVFRPNFADFEGLERDVVDNNNRILRRLAQILNKFRDYRIQVEGHANPTFPRGPERDREETELRRLSEARARAVVDLLVRNGVARSRLSSIGAGGSSPVAEFEDRDNWWKNRRVEFILIK
ncbi:MAG: OmpA family protein [Treponema sp.]|nr:OmpA family protein [Treponema sp.]